MAKTQWKGGALLAPVPPVLVSCGSLAAPNVCTAAWCGMASTHPPRTYISLRPGRHSYGLIMHSGEYVLNLPTAALVRAIDYCGVKSGRDEDKLATCGLTAAPSFEVSAPAIVQSPLSLECRVFQTLELGSHHMLLADIVAVAVDEALVDEAGRLDLARAGLCAYAHGEYFRLGDKIGSFGFSVRKRPPSRRKRP